LITLIKFSKTRKRIKKAGKGLLAGEQLVDGKLEICKRLKTS
jgi:hypothetical protein